MISILDFRLKKKSHEQFFDWLSVEMPSSSPFGMKGRSRGGFRPAYFVASW